MAKQRFYICSPVGDGEADTLYDMCQLERDFLEKAKAAGKPMAMMWARSYDRATGMSRTRGIDEKGRQTFTNWIKVSAFLPFENDLLL